MGNAPYLETEPREMRHWQLQYASRFADAYMYRYTNK